MKNAFALLALAATLGEVTATFRGANPFTCPENTDNKCDDKQKPGFNWGDLNPGKFNDYGGFNWNGWTCANQFSKRDELAPRTFGGKVIEGSCFSDKSKSPSFGCDTNKGVDKFSIKHFDISVEFDCDLEFHYDMPDGSKCKHRSKCSKQGTTVKNSQCGGAKNVTIVYPPQPNKPKTTCGVGIHTISFDCNTPKPPKTTSKSTTKTTFATTTTNGIVTRTSVASTTSTTSTTPAVETKPTTTPAQTTTTSALPVESTTTKPFVNTTSTAPGTTSVPPTTITEVTSFMTTSTIFTTIVSTVTSCKPDVPNCPGGSTALTTVTVPLTTTICPVTETHTRTTSLPPKPDSTKPTTTEILIPTSSKPAPPPPTVTLPCPDVVPSCLNTWLFSVACSDNTDTACFCPDTLFVENVFTCLYAHGQTDQIISEAVLYFQGICAPHAPQNPAIITGAQTITQVITVTSPATVPAIYTTVTLDATTVVPCTTDGTEIPGSSTTVTIQTTVAVPQVGFQTGTDNAVVPVPVTSFPPVQAITTPSGPTPTGTGSLRPSASQTRVLVGSGATKGQVQAGMGFGLAVLAVLAAL